MTESIPASGGRTDAPPTASSTAPPAPGFRLATSVLVICLLGANLRTAISAVGPVMGDIRASEQLNAIAAASLVSIPLFAFALVSPIASIVIARLGIKRALVVSLLGLVLGLLIRSAPIPTAIWWGTAILGAALAILNVVLPTIVKRDFPDRIGPVTSAYSITQTLTAAIAAGVAVPLTATALGWRLSLGVWAIVAAITLVVVLLSIRGTGSTGTVHVVVNRSYRSPWRSAVGWWVTLFMGTQSVMFFTFSAWLPSIEGTNGVPASTAGYYQLLFVGVGSLGSLIGAALLPRLSDQRALTVGATSAHFVALVGLAWMPAALVCWVVLAGMGCGLAIVTALSLFGLRSTNYRQVAVLSGMAQGVGYLIATFGPLAVGWLHDATDGWQAPLTALMCVTVVQFVSGYQAGRRRLIAFAE